ncbi:MAG: hypothetical protein J6C97_03835 [Clostridia bacterium]|nr:hypothetical protein [Clostridia bacterium]
MKILSETKKAVKKLLEENSLDQGVEDSKKDQLKEQLDKEKDDYFTRTVGSKITTDLSRVSDKDLKILADKFYEKQKLDKKLDAEKEYNSKVESAESALSNKQSNLSEKLKEIGDKLNKQISTLKEKSLKNNVARSSIVSNGEQGYKQEADKSQGLVEEELQKAQEQRDLKVNNAKEELDKANYKIDYEYAQPIADKQNELQELKDNNSSYAKSLVNRTALKDYDNKILSLINGFVAELGEEKAKEILQKDDFLSEYLSKSQIEELQKKYNW